ncbi:MAG: SPOR domain-containing protein [candidate division KSB1 bacterium]|nr:SPOR domain-containing protein [candidate division KSB1 bacterium]
MAKNIIKQVRWWLLAIVIWAGAWAQDEFVQFTYYDQLTWSPDGKQLAFRCILLDESQPERFKIHILVKDLALDRLVCLNPQPEQLVVAQDKKQLIFSSSFGLYLMSLKPLSPPVQIYFRDPTSKWYFQEFGFLKKDNGIYIDRFEPGTGQTMRHYFSLPTGQIAAAGSSWVEPIAKERIRSSTFNLREAAMSTSEPRAMKLKKATLQFVSRAEPGGYDLVLQPSGLRAQAATVLLKNVRPRLLSTNPRQSDAILSVLSSTGNLTFHYAMSSGKFSAIDSSRYYALAWLDEDRYLCITDQGLMLRSLDRSLDQKLNDWPMPSWCHSISLALPQYELQVGFEPDRPAAEKIAARLAKLGYFARIKYFQDEKKSGYRIRLGGFSTKIEAQQFASQLKRHGFKYWIVPIDDWYDYFNAEHAGEHRRYDESTEAIIEYKFDRYLRSRIVLKRPGQPARVIVDEMNNIPDRGNW